MRRLLLLAGLLGALFLVVLLAVPRDVGQIRGGIDGAGAWAPVVYVVAAAALTVGFFPFPVVAGAGGLLFGIAAGTVLALVGETIGATIALLIGRFGARDSVARMARPRLRRLLDEVARRGFASVLLVRVLPGVPRHPANYVFGLTAVGVAPFVAATLLGTAPRAFAYAALGGSLGDLTSPESIAAVALLVLFALLGLGLLARERRRRRPPVAAGVPEE